MPLPPTTMPNLERHLDRLAAAEQWGYRASRKSAAEPAAWAALALAAHGRIDQARRPAQWLASIQQPDGAVGVTAADLQPCWPTSLALWAWCAVDHAADQISSPSFPLFAQQRRQAVRWSLAAQGKTAPRSSHVGHNPQLVGWSWAADTHSWLEPTCFFILALRAAGKADHARVRQGVELIFDRLLPDGGANYGNTTVLGQRLLAHIEPTGLALLTVADQGRDDPRIADSLDLLEQIVDVETSAASLAFALLGLSAHGRLNDERRQWIAAALDDQRRQLAVFEQALLLLAASSGVVWLPPAGPVDECVVSNPRLALGI